MQKPAEKPLKVCLCFACALIKVVMHYTSEESSQATSERLIFLSIAWSRRFKVFPALLKRTSNRKRGCYCSSRISLGWIGSNLDFQV